MSDRLISDKNHNEKVRMWHLHILALPVVTKIWNGKAKNREKKQTSTEAKWMCTESAVELSTQLLMKFIANSVKFDQRHITTINAKSPSAHEINSSCQLHIHLRVLPSPPPPHFNGKNLKIYSSPNRIGQWR